jgi:hypothetical protein
MTSVVQKIRSVLNDHPAACDLFLLTLAYTIAHGLMLLNHGVFWDDWILYNMDTAIILGTFDQAGSVWTAYLHLLVSSAGASGYRAVVFACYLIAAWCLFGVLSRLNIGRYERLFIVIFFAIFPVNSARIAMINMPSAFCYALFFCGFWMTSRYIRTRSPWPRVAAILLLFVSFSANSLLVFYLLIILYIMYYERPEPMSLSSWLRLAPRFADYLLLPILFWLVKITFMKPYGLYEGYNQIGVSITAFFSSLYHAFHASFFSVIYHVFGDPFIPAFQYDNLNFGNVSPLLMYGLALLIAAFLLYNYRHGRNKQNIILLLLGVFIFYLGIIPYAVVGKFPANFPFQLDWGSRHQLLVPLGAAFMLVYTTKILVNSQIAVRLALLVFTIAFISANIYNYAAFQRDWYKQVSLMENFRLLPIMGTDTSFLIDDGTLHLNANRRSYRFYEYSGLFKMAFGDEKRFGHDRRLFITKKTLKKLDRFLNKHNNLSEFQPKEPERIITIHRGKYELTMNNLIALMIAERIDKKEFLIKARNIVSLSERRT